MKLTRAMALVTGAALLPGLAGAETMRSETMEADLTRRAVALSSKEGDTIRAEQVNVTLRRRDGQPIGAGEVESYVPIAERAACKGRKVLVSVIVGASEGAGRFDVLCAAGGE
ncbi:MAG: hypothetical protein RIG84_12960 [Roseovarius sp.]